MEPKLDILVSGATGLIGTALCNHLVAQGHSVHALTRQPARQRDPRIQWIEWSGSAPPHHLPARIDAVINLAGENIASHRWTVQYKAALLNSRVETTRHLIAGLSRATLSPRLFLSASASGYYGNSGASPVSEESPSGTGFLASVTEAWEKAASEAAALGSTVTLMRFGVVLTPDGGALPRMTLPFKFGVGGRLGNGAQFMSWISLADLISAITFLIHHPLSGPVNLSAPDPCSNTELTSALAEVLHRPAFFTVPAWALHLLMGEMADELLLFSTRAIPARLQNAGFIFAHPSIRGALELFFHR